MTDYATLYLSNPKPIPQSFVERNAPFAQVSPQPNGAPGYYLMSQGWRMAMNVMPAEQIPQHVHGFHGYVASVTGGAGSPAAQHVLQRLGEVKCVLGFVVEPGFDPAGDARRTVAALAAASKALLFAHNAVFDSDSTLLVGPPASPPRFLPSALTPPQRWALATSGIVTHYFEESHETLGGVLPTPEGRDKCRDELADPWGIDARSELIERLKDLSQPESETRFAHLMRRVAAGTAADDDETSDEDIAFVRANGALIGPRGLLADSLGRLVHVAGMGYVAGLFSEAEAWNFILPAADRLQRAYGSWQEFGHHYLLGVQYRRGWDDDLAEAYRELLADPSSPWNTIPWVMPLH